MTTSNIAANASGSSARRPRVVCHMLTSIDGRIVVSGWPLSSHARSQYEVVHKKYEANAWMCGRVTMEPFARSLRSEEEVAQQYSAGSPRSDFRAPGNFESFAFAIDASGRLAWQSNEIDGDHVVAILSERVSNEYLEFLRERGISYVLAGKHDVDLALALNKIASNFHVETVMLEGGGKVNGGLLHAGLIDEVSVLIAPIADGRIGTAALFDVEASDSMPRKLALESMEQLADEVVWLRYRVNQ